MFIYQYFTDEESMEWKIKQLKDMVLDTSIKREIKIATNIYLRRVDTLLDIWCKINLLVICHISNQGTQFSSREDEMEDYKDYVIPKCKKLGCKKCTTSRGIC